MFQLCGVVVLLCFLEWLPSKRIPWVANGVWTLIFLFLAVEFVKINLPPAPTKESAVATVPFFGELSNWQLKRVSEIVFDRTYETNELIFEQGIFIFQECHPNLGNGTMQGSWRGLLCDEI